MYYHGLQTLENNENRSSVGLVIFIVFSCLETPGNTLALVYEILLHLHIKQTEISQKRSKETENCKRCYFVILSVLLNKTNLIFVS